MMMIPDDSTFNRLPTVVVGLLFGNLPIGDRVRMRLVCKSWRDVLLRSDFPVKPEPPWLILPIDSYDQPEHLSTETSFESMSEKRTYRFELPVCRNSGRRYRWCCCGSGSGWLLMAGRRAGRDVSETVMMLWDPISGTTKRLPALSTLPFFGELVDSCKRAGVDIFSTPVVMARAQVFSVGSVECMVAIVFSGSLSLNLNRLALCSPQEQSWSVVPYGPGEYYRDVLFHNGHLYTICKATLVSSPSSSGLLGVRRSHCTVRLSCCDVEVTKLETRYDKKYLYHRGGADINLPPIGSTICKRWNVAQHLVGSARGELLVVSAVIDKYSYNGGGQGPPIPTHTHTLTTGFEVHGLDMNDGLKRLRSVGKQCVFVGATGSTSLIGGNVIHFATCNAYGIHWDNNQVCRGTFFLHERGVFDVAQDRIDMPYSRYFRPTTRSCVGWFTPKL